MENTRLSGWLMAALLVMGLVGCGGGDGMGGHVQNDPGRTGSAGDGAVPSDNATHGSGAMSGFGANGDPVTGTGNLGSGSTRSDPENGSNQMGPAVPF